MPLLRRQKPLRRRPVRGVVLTFETVNTVDGVEWIDLTEQTAGSTSGVDIVRRTGAIEGTRAAARAQAAEAQACLQVLQPSSARDLLIKFCAGAVERST